MSNKRSGARSKGSIRNMTTGSTKKFLYNPTTFIDSQGARYGSIESPCCSYPLTQFLGGSAKEITFDLFLHDFDSTQVAKYIKFLNGFLPKRGSRFTRPPKLRFCFGKYIEECVLEDLECEYQELDNKLRPIQVVAKLKLRVV